MNKRDIPGEAIPAGGPQLRAALDVLCKIVIDGLHHGFFDGTISVEQEQSARIVDQGRQELQVYNTN